jgi:hypothetical protein
MPCILEKAMRHTLALIALVALCACAPVRRDLRGVRVEGSCAADTLIHAAAIAAEVATEEPQGPWCDPANVDPPHTCPAQVADPR